MDGDAPLLPPPPSSAAAAPGQHPNAVNAAQEDFDWISDAGKERTAVLEALIASNPDPKSLTGHQDASFCTHSLSLLSSALSNHIQFPIRLFCCPTMKRKGIMPLNRNKT